MKKKKKLKPGPNKWINEAGDTILSYERPPGFQAHINYSRVLGQGEFKPYDSGFLVWRQNANERLKNLANS